MAFMQRYTQARESIARIEEMQSQARYREAQAQVQAVEMMRKAKEDERKAKMQAELAKLQSAPTNAGAIAMPSMGYLRQNPQALEELQGLQAALAQNSALTKLYKEYGNDKFIEVEKNNNAIRTRMTAIGDAAAKFEEDQKKELAQAGIALANAPNESLFHATWAGLPQGVRSQLMQRGMPLDENGMPRMLPGVQGALRSIATASMTTSEQAALQRDAVNKANTDADNERAARAEARAIEAHKLQQQVARQNLLEAKRRESGELTPLQKQEAARKEREQDQQDRDTANRHIDRAQTVIDRAERDMNFDKRNRTSNLGSEALAEMKRYGHISPETQRGVRASFLAATNDYRSRYGDTAYRSEEFEKLMSTLGSAGAWLQTVGEGGSVLDNETARKINRFFEIDQQFANAQIAEKYLTVRNQLSAKLDDDERLSKFAKAGELTTTANLQQYVKFLEGKRGKSGEPLTGVLKDGTRWVTLSNGRTVPLPQDD